MIGHTLAHYKIVEKIGSGGMGDVYRAHDSKLGRDVALKVLSADMADDPERRMRFEREARAVASLKHPNIVTIHSVEEVDGTHFITMELVDGQTLSALIPKNGVTLETFLEYGVSIADAVSSAHDSGITHRDLKPANIMVDADGRLKVLDFGLAKLVEATPDPNTDKTVADSDTAEGVILGTVAYMSPEQAEGRDIDHRSDVFSLGVILYEMATGARPFEGETRISTMSAILRDDPTPVTEMRQTLPRHLGRIVKRCMAKKPTRRYQSALDLRNDLEELKEEVESGETLITGQMAALKRPAQRPKWLLPVIAVAAVVAVAVVVVFMRGSGDGSAPVTQAPGAAMEMVPITSNGRASEATISADGRYVCYSQEDDQRRAALWVSQVATGSSVEIVPARENVFIWDPTFSPDGNFIYFISVERGPDKPALYRVPVLGGAPQKVKDHVNQRVSFSPDAMSIAFMRAHADHQELVTARLDGGVEQVLATRAAPRVFTGDPVWSPDGKVIAVPVRDFTDGVKAAIVTVPADGGDGHEFATDERWTDLGELSWLPDGSGLVAEIEQSHIQNNIWEVAYPSGDARRITGDLNNYHGVEITADASVLVTQQMQPRRNMWVITDGGAPQQVTHVGRGIGAEEFDWLPDGRIIYSANTNGTWDLWIMNGDGSGAQRLTSNQYADVEPRVSLDGRNVAWISDRGGAINIWTMATSNGSPRQLTQGSFAVQAAWVTGDEIVFMSWGEQPGQQRLYKMPLSGGEPVLLTSMQATSAVASPDGTRILANVHHPDEDRYRLDVIVVATGETEQSMYIEGREEATWSPDGKAIHYSFHTGAVDNIWSQPFDGSEPEQITHFDEENIYEVRWSRDGRSLGVTRGVNNRDIVLLKNFR